MHRDLLSLTRSIALDDLLEGLAVFLPDLSLLAAEADVLLEALSKSERCLALRSTMAKTVLLVCDKGIENPLELVAVAVCVKCEAWERRHSLSEETCLKP
jgi:hypothetical protein